MAQLVEHRAVMREVAGSNPGRINSRDLKISDEKAQVTQAHCVCHIGKYREHMRGSLGLEICNKMEIKIDETYHVVSCCCL